MADEFKTNSVSLPFIMPAAMKKLVDQSASEWPENVQRLCDLLKMENWGTTETHQAASAWESVKDSAQFPKALRVYKNDISRAIEVAQKELGIGGYARE
jgi:hypothetical protein